jgi:hypothetical protein
MPRAVETAEQKEYSKPVEHLSRQEYHRCVAGPKLKVYGLILKAASSEQARGSSVSR